jgi:hypothetical protein
MRARRDAGRFGDRVGKQQTNREDVGVTWIELGCARDVVACAVAEWFKQLVRAHARPRGGDQAFDLRLRCRGCRDGASGQGRLGTSGCRRGRPHYRRSSSRPFRRRLDGGRQIVRRLRVGLSRGRLVVCGGPFACERSVRNHWRLNLRLRVRGRRVRFRRCLGCRLAWQERFLRPADHRILRRRLRIDGIRERRL